MGKYGNIRYESGSNELTRLSSDIIRSYIQSTKDNETWADRRAILEAYDDENFERNRRLQEEDMDNQVFLASLKSEQNMLEDQIGDLNAALVEKSTLYQSITGKAYEASDEAIIDTEDEFAAYKTTLENKGLLKTIDRFEDATNEQYNEIFLNLQARLESTVNQIEEIDLQTGYINDLTTAFVDNAKVNAQEGLMVDDGNGNKVPYQSVEGLDFITYESGGKTYTEDLWTDKDWEQIAAISVADVNKMYAGLKAANPNDKRYTSYDDWDLSNLQPWQESILSKLRDKGEWNSKMNDTILASARSKVALETAALQQAAIEEQSELGDFMIDEKKDIERSKIYMQQRNIIIDYFKNNQMYMTTHGGMDTLFQNYNAAYIALEEAKGTNDSGEIENAQAVFNVHQQKLMQHPLFKVAGGNIKQFNLYYAPGIITKAGEGNPLPYVEGVIHMIPEIVEGDMKLTGYLKEEYSKYMTNNPKSEATEEAFIRKGKLEFYKKLNKSFGLTENVKKYGDSVGFNEEDMKQFRKWYAMMAADSPGGDPDPNVIDEADATLVDNSYIFQKSAALKDVMGQLGTYSKTMPATIGAFDKIVIDPLIKQFQGISNLSTISATSSSGTKLPRNDWPSRRELHDMNYEDQLFWMEMAGVDVSGTWWFSKDITKTNAYTKSLLYTYGVVPGEDTIDGTFEHRPEPTDKQKAAVQKFREDVFMQRRKWTKAY